MDLPGLDMYYGTNGTEEKNMKQWKPESLERAATHRESGFVAQEVEEAAKQTGFTFSGVDKPGNDKALYGLRYGDFVLPLVKAVQEQQVIIEEQNKKIELLLKELQLIKEKLK